MLWPDQKRVRYTGIQERMADGSEGRRMLRVKGARHTHAKMRAQGRTPGDEGRAAIARNRELRRQQREHEAFMRALSLADPQQQTEMILARKAAEERARIERLAQQ
jgi:hypothetical protein